MEITNEKEQNQTRKYVAAEKKRCGTHNCAQAILNTYADIASINEETAMNIVNAFGAGMGNMEGTCGGLVEACLGLGQQGQSQIHEADATNNEQVPRTKRSYPMQTTKGGRNKSRAA